MEIIIILILILLCGILAMSEIAMVSSTKLKLKSESNRGDKKAKKALNLIHNPYRFLSTAQIGTTLIGILLGLFSGKVITNAVASFISKSDFLAPYSNSIASGVVVVLVTYFSLVLGELFPNRIAMSATEKT